MRVLAFDPDTAHTGWSVVSTSDFRECQIEACGVIRSSTSLKGDDRVIDQVRQQRIQFPRELASGVDAVLVEGQYAGKATVYSTVMVAQSAGGLVSQALEYNDRVHVVSPTDWTGGFDKKTRQNRVTRLWFKITESEVAGMAGCLKSQANHVIDSIGIARWYLLNHNKTLWTGRNQKVRRRRRRRRSY